MYRINDKKAAIKEIQKYLYVISDAMYDKKLPRVSITSVFDSETTAAILKYQELNGLKESGIVDYNTFTSLYRDYSSIIKEKSVSDFIVGETPFPLSKGTQSEDVRALHIIINELTDRFDSIENVGYGAYYSTATVNAVKTLRRIFGFEITETVDKQLYERLRKELAVLNSMRTKATLVF